MSHPIEFFFDLVSPYSYLASEKIEELAHVTLGTDLETLPARWFVQGAGCPSCSGVVAL